MGRPPKADGGKTGQRRQMRGKDPHAKKTLEAPNPEEVVVPDLPNAADFLSPWDMDPDDPARDDIQWSPIVVNWWNDIWTSPMSQEFVLPADLHGLYLGCYYLQRSIDPALKPGEQNNMSKSFDSVQKQYGLTPQARSTLKWQVAQGETAQQRTDDLRKRSNAAKVKPDPNDNTIVDLYSRHQSTGTDFS